MTILENFSDYDRPALFGLPANIERSWQRTTSALVINQLKSKDHSQLKPCMDAGGLARITDSKTFPFYF